MEIKALYRNKLSRNKFDYVDGNAKATSQIFNPYSTGSVDGKNGEDGIVVSLEKYNLSIPGNYTYADPFYDEVRIHATEGSVELPTYIGPLENIPVGMTVNIRQDGTTNSYLAVEIADNHSCFTQSGHIKVPVATENGSSLYYNTFLSWGITFKGQDGESVYRLDLTNANTSIGANSDGSIPSSAERPSCTATLYYGDDKVNEARYYISYPSTQGVQGVSINSTTGVLTFNAGTSTTPFTFTGDRLAITVTAKVGSYVKGTNTMTICKAKVGANGESYWTLDLSNDNASINADSDGNILTGARRPTCTARLYYGTTLTSCVYSITYPSSQSVKGVSINSSTGVLTFNAGTHTTPFSFTGDTLAIDVIAIIGGVEKIRKTMNVTKSMAGVDGKNPTSYWLSFSANKIKVDVNNGNACTPSTITAKCYKQTGEGDPVEATDTVIRWGYDTTSPTTQYTGAITVDGSKGYMSFAAFVGGKMVDGIENIPLIKEGKNGTDGDNVYRLDLSNENAGINADSAGNILPTAIRPTCTATLYYGTTAVTNANYTISYPSQSVKGITINATTGVITLNAGTHATPFSFTGTSLAVTVTAKVSGSTKGIATFNISKSYAGVNGNDGDDAVTYWVSFSSNVIKIDKAGTANPTKLTATQYKQVGGGTPAVTTDMTIKYSYDSTTPTTTYTGTITIDTSKKFLTFGGYRGSSLACGMYTIPILMDGTDGKGVASPFRGEYDPATIYYGNENRTDICHYRKVNPTTGEILVDSYFIARNDVGEFINVEPTDTNYWKPFGASYSSVATDFLFAEEVVIENGVIRKLRTNETGKRIYVENNTIQMFDSSNNLKMVVSGDTLSDSIPSTTSFVLNSFYLTKYFTSADFRDGKEYFGTETLTSSFNVVNATNEVVIPSQDISVGLIVDTSPSSGYVGVRINGTIKVDERTVEGVSTFIYIEPYETSKSGTATIPGVSVTGLSVGTHNVTFEWTIQCAGEDSFGNIGTATYTVNMAQHTGNVRYPIQKIEIGENGLRCTFDSDNIFKITKTGSTINMSLQTGNYGIECTNSGLKFRIGGVWYTGTRVYNSTLAGYYLKLS